MGSRRIVKAVNNYLYQVESLRNGALEEVHISRLKFYCENSVDKEAVMSHVLLSETRTVVQRLMPLEGAEDGLIVEVRWHGLPESEDTLEPIEQTYKNVPQLYIKLLHRKNTPSDLADKASQDLQIASF